MTSYECGSLTVAVAALLISIIIPLSQFVYAKNKADEFTHHSVRSLPSPSSLW